MQLDGESSVKVTIQMKKETWVGLALGDSGMAEGTDMWQIDGERLIAHDKISSGYAYPSTDGNQDLDYTFTDIGNNLLEVAIIRDLDTGDG